MNRKILLVEDDKQISKLLRYNLEREGYRVLQAYDGEAGLASARKERPDLMVLDVLLPKLDGLEVCKQVRRETQVPIIFLTAKRDAVDRVLGLELGADDYVPKPFSVREVLSRIRAILRRSSAPERGAGMLRAGTIELDEERYEARVQGRAVSLSSKEFELLRYLLESRGRALTRDAILEKLWGYDRSMEIDTRTVDQHVKRIRGKLGPEAGRLLTVKNVGYRLKTD